MQNNFVLPSFETNNFSFEENDQIEKALDENSEDSLKEKMEKLTVNREKYDIIGFPLPAFGSPGVNLNLTNNKFNSNLGYFEIDDISNNNYFKDKENFDPLITPLKNKKYSFNSFNSMGLSSFNVSRSPFADITPPLPRKNKTGNKTIETPKNLYNCKEKNNTNSGKFKLHLR